MTIAVDLGRRATQQTNNKRTIVVLENTYMVKPTLLFGDVSGLLK